MITINARIGFGGFPTCVLNSLARLFSSRAPLNYSRSNSYGYPLLIVLLLVFILVMIPAPEMVTCKLCGRKLRINRTRCGCCIVKCYHLWRSRNNPEDKHKFGKLARLYTKRRRAKNERRRI